MVNTPKYEYGRIDKLDKELRKTGTPEGLIGEIMAGGEGIRRGTSPAQKAAWMGEAMRRMERLLDLDTCHAIREGCACCLGGKRLKLAKQIATSHQTLEDRISAASETKMVFGHDVSLQGDGKVLVRFQPDDLPQYRCVCLPAAAEPLPITYCYCCAGHVKHHLQTALGRPLAIRVRSSALSSGGKAPCTFVAALIG
jgi:hypothetical protein